MDEKPIKAQIWKYSVDSSIGDEDIGVLDLRASDRRGYYKNASQRIQGTLTFINLNGVQFRKISEYEIKMEHFNVVQQVFDGCAQDVTWTTQQFEAIFLVKRLGYGDICSMVDGRYGVDALGDALVEAGAIDITQESMFDF